MPLRDNVMVPEWNHNEKNWIPFQRKDRTYVARGLSCGLGRWRSAGWHIFGPRSTPWSLISSTSWSTTALAHAGETTSHRPYAAMLAASRRSEWRTVFPQLAQMQDRNEMNAGNAPNSEEASPRAPWKQEKHLDTAFRGSAQAVYVDAGSRDCSGSMKASRVMVRRS